MKAKPSCKPPSEALKFQQNSSCEEMPDTSDLPLWVKWEFPEIRVTFLGVPIIRIVVFWGPYWGPLILGNYQMFGASRKYLSSVVTGSRSTCLPMFVYPVRDLLKSVR